MGATLGRKHAPVEGKGTSSSVPLPSTSKVAPALSFKYIKGLKQPNSASEFNLLDLANNITHRFSVLSGLSFISFVNVPAAENTRRPWSRVSRKRWQPNTLQNEYAQCKAVWPVAQTEALFLPEFPVGIEEKFKLIFVGELSRGAFGQVFHVRCTTTHKEFAMKVLSKSQVCSLDAVAQVKQEVMIQHVCSHHPFITPLAHFWQTRQLLIVMTEYVGYGELQQLWRSLGCMPENLLGIYVAEIAIAIDFLHNAGIIYRDLKMENILLDVDGHIKLVDFGLSRWLTYGGRTRTICGTLQFMAPEILKGEEYGHTADWWSLGIIAYCLLVGHYPITGYDDHVSMCGAVEKFAYDPPENCSKGMKNLLKGLLERSPPCRIHSLHKLEKEEIFKDIDFDDVKDKKILPRAILEKYVESKSRSNFENFEGLTSTPKKGALAMMSMGGFFPTSRGSTSHLHQASKFSNLPMRGGRTVPWDRSRRSSSSPLLCSPLLHPGRLGHHDAIIKSVSASSYNGAAVPLLQSPLLRLARGQGRPVRSKRSERAVSASALPTAVSPMLVNVRGNRRAPRWQMRERTVKEKTKTVRNEEKDSKETDSSSSPIHTDGIDILSGMNGVYQKCLGGNCENPSRNAKGSKTNPEQPKLDIDKPICSSPILSLKTLCKKDNFEFLNKGDLSSLPPAYDNFLYNVENLKDEFFSDLVTSTPKKENNLKKNCPIRQSYRKAISSPSQVGKCGLINGALLGSNNNYSPLDENDFDDAFEHFPWISESIDT